jgi:hypothetical protein
MKRIVPIASQLRVLVGIAVISALTICFTAKSVRAFDPQASKKQRQDNAAEFLSAPKKNADCMASGKNPDADCTPGAAMGISQTVVCTTATKGRRNVDTAMRKQVYEAYELSYPQPTGMYEVDHFIPLELGGSNDIANLWPQPANPVPGFHQKDCVEDYLHAQVCTVGSMSLADAQRAIVSDWMKVYTEKAKGSGIGQCKKWGK